MKSSNGAKSTARIYHDLINAPKDLADTEDPIIDNEEIPTYVTLWEKTKRHKDGSWDPEAQLKYDEFKQLHSEQIEKHGVDNLSVKEAFVTVLKEKNRYITGLGLGPRLTRKGNRQDQSTKERVQLSNEFQRLHEQELELRNEINDFKSSNAELRDDVKRMKQDSLAREK